MGGADTEANRKQQANLKAMVDVGGPPPPKKKGKKLNKNRNWNEIPSLSVKLGTRRRASCVHAKQDRQTAPYLFSQ
jgi:hypothetical protein